MQLIFKITDYNPDKRKVLDIFFKHWVDIHCHNEVNYNTNLIKIDCTKAHEAYVYAVNFDNPEDALAIKLTGVPDEFKNYLEIIEQSN